MNVGLALPHYDFSFPDHARVTMDRVVDAGVRAERLGFDSVWVSDHLFLDIQRYGSPAGRHATPEALAMMGSIVDATERVRVGSLVLCTPFRNAAVLALAAQSLHDRSRGRIELGLGAGWYEDEFLEAGIDYGTPGSRIAALDAYAAELGRRIPDGPPLWIGGKGGPKIMRLVAARASGWNVVWQMTPETYAERLEVLERACVSVGRDPRTVRRSVGLSTLVGTDADDLARRYAALQAWTPGGALDGVSLETFAAGRLVGTVKECAARIADFADLGVEEVIVSFAGLPFAIFDDEQVDLFAADVIPLVR